MTRWSIYHGDIPQFLLDFASTDAMVRLKNIGMNCGVEYTNFPVYRDSPPYSRFDHSLGVALIVWHFTQDIKQAVAGLFHDISTPVFAHVVDFLNGDHLQQESTEERTMEIISRSDQIRGLLTRYGLSVEDVCDYHRYPIADNDSPLLSADRLEYSLANAVNYRFRTRAEVQAYYEDLTIEKNESGEDELAFRSPELACAFAQAALCNSKVYVTDEDRYSMQFLADMLRVALDGGVLREEDLYSTEPQVILKLQSGAPTAALWQQFRGFSAIHRTDQNPGLPQWMSVPAKKRCVDPLVVGHGRTTELSQALRKDMADFLNYSFAYWISATV